MKTFVLLLCAVAVMADPKFYRMGVEIEGKQVKEDLMLEEKYAMVTVEDAEKVIGCKNTVNLHDFETGYSAFKSIELGKCLIYKGKRTLEEVETKLFEDRYGDKKMLREDILSTKTEQYIDNEKLGVLAGEKIRAFCADYDAVVYELLKGNQKRSRSRRSARGCWAACGICFVSLD